MENSKIWWADEWTSFAFFVFLLSIPVLSVTGAHSIQHTSICSIHHYKYKVCVQDVIGRACCEEKCDQSEARSRSHHRSQSSGFSSDRALTTLQINDREIWCVRMCAVQAGAYISVELNVWESRNSYAYVKNKDSCSLYLHTALFCEECRLLIAIISCGHAPVFLSLSVFFCHSFLSASLPDFLILVLISFDPQPLCLLFNCLRK